MSLCDFTTHATHSCDCESHGIWQRCKQYVSYSPKNVLVGMPCTCQSWVLYSSWAFAFLSFEMVSLALNPSAAFHFYTDFFRMSHKALKTFANKIKCGENSLLREHEQFCGFACFLMSNLIVGSLFKLCKCITQPMNRWKMIKDVLIWFFLWRMMAVQPNDTWLQHHDDCLQILLRLILCRDPFL